MATFKSWVEAMRLRTLPVSVAGVIAGTGVAVACHGFNLVPALICLLFAVMAQVVSNFANEYFDFRNGLDRKGREGFRRGVTEGDISPRAMLVATLSLLAATCLVGLSLIYWGGWQMIIVGVAVAIFALAYSTGPYPLSHHGLGDIAVVIFFGLVPVIFTAYLQAGSWTILRIAIPIATAVGLAAANVLIVNNYRDMEDDQAVGKHTTVVLLGRHTMGNVYLLNGFIAAALVILAYFLGPEMNIIWFLGPIIYFNQHYRLWLSLKAGEGAALNPLLGKTSLLLLAYSLWILISYTI